MLWLTHDGTGKVAVEGVESTSGDELSGDSEVGDIGIAATAFTLKVGDVAVDVGYDGAFKAPADSGVTIRYMKSTGAFSGSFKVSVVNAKGRTMKKRVSFNGVFVDGVGYGTTTKGSAGVPMVIEAK